MHIPASRILTTIKAMEARSSADPLILELKLSHKLKEGIVKRIQQRFKEKQYPKHLRSSKDLIKIMVMQESVGMSEFDATILIIKEDLQYIENTSGKLAGKIIEVNGKLSNMGVEKVVQLSSITMLSTFIDLHGSMMRLSKYLGFEISK